MAKAFISTPLQPADSFPPTLRRLPQFAIDSRRSRTLVLRNTSYRIKFRGQRASQHPLQGFHPAPVTFPHRLRNSNLHPSHVPFNLAPIDGIPVGRRMGSADPVFRPDTFMLLSYLESRQAEGASPPEGQTHPSGEQQTPQERVAPISNKHLGTGVCTHT